MRKMTIFRSSSLAAVAVALCAAAPQALNAQDTLQVAGQPKVHVVQPGETLWGLAAQYLGDPFLWPAIYRLNTTVVEDPHWIFPGEELVLGGVDTTQAGRAMPAQPAAPEQPEAAQQPAPVEPQAPPPPPTHPNPPPPPTEAAVTPESLPPPAPPPPPPTQSGPSVFARVTDIYGGVSGGVSAALGYKPVRRGEFYSSGFLTENQDLPWGRVLGAVGRPTLSNLQASSSATVYGNVEIRPPQNGAYQVGDSLLFARVTRKVEDWGNIVVPTGIGVVREVADDHAIAELVQQFDRVADGQRALPLEPFVDPGMVTPVPVSNGLAGELVARRHQDPVAGQQDIVFIDKGRQDGVVLGDVFSVMRPSDEQGVAPQMVGTIQIVHVRDHTATGLLIGVYDLGIDAGASVQLARKMPS
jgi:hypothetical protein